MQQVPPVVFCTKRNKPTNLACNKAAWYNKRFMKELLNLFDFKQKINYKTEILSGLTVALALVPEAVAFSLIAALVFAWENALRIRARKLTERYAALGKRVHLRHLSRDCQQLLKDADSIIEVNIMEDPTYKVLVNKKDVKRKQQQEKQ